ncbi:MAG: hypothetical protein U1D55_04025 [Phycisphaerae bacterium]
MITSVFSARVACYALLAVGFPFFTDGNALRSVAAAPISLAVDMQQFDDRTTSFGASHRDTGRVANPNSDDAVFRVYRVTAYCDQGVTAAGVPSGLGQCAAPDDIPFGSIVFIPSLDRSFVVTDRTHRRFRKNTVDLFLKSQAECIEFGRHYLECEIRVAADPPRYGSQQFVTAARKLSQD